jgi:hypothetical protein
VSVRVSGSNLGQAAKELSAEWQQTKNYWYDVKSREFEETYLSELPHAIHRAMTVIEELDALIRKVRSECG